jgi:hypothetical protein
MRIRNVVITPVLVLLLMTAIAAQGKAAVDLLEQAQRAERTQGLEAAIPIYERVVSEFPQDRANASKALARIVKDYEVLGETDRMKDACQRLLRTYPNQPDTGDVRERCSQSRFRVGPAVFLADMDPRTGQIRDPGQMSDGVDRVEASPAFSPDGKSLTFRVFPDLTSQAMIDAITAKGTVYVRRLAEKTELTLSTCGIVHGGRSLWFPDGDVILTFAAKASTVCMQQASAETGDSVKPEINLPSDWLSAFTALTLDGSTLHAIRVSPYPAGAEVLNVSTVDTLTGLPRRTFGLPIDMVDMKGTLARNSSIIGISPDGRTIGLIRGALSGDAKLVLLDSDGLDRHYRPLVDGGGWKQNVVWSKDGSRIFYASSADGTVWDVMQVPADGSRKPSFTGLEITGLRYFDINRDNTRIAFDGVSFAMRPLSYTPGGPVQTPGDRAK